MDNNNSKSVSVIMGTVLPIILCAVLVVLDQLSKIAIRSGMKLNDDIDLIKGVFSIHYIENSGMAFSMMEGMTWFFYIVTPVIVFGCIYIFVRLPRKSRLMPLVWCISVLVAGAVGNYIDRLLKKSVTDFLYFKLINFPVFNVADIYVVCSVIALILLLLFFYKEGELDGVI